MKRRVESISGKPNPSANVVDGTLILSLPDAVTPVVWRLDLGQSKASALEVREIGNLHHLVLKTPKGDVQDIAPYNDRERAVAALMVVSHAMEHQTITRPVANDASVITVAGVEAKKEGKNGGRFATAAVAVALVIAVLWLISSIGPRQVKIADNDSSASSPATVAPAAGGEPVSADSFLQNRQ